MSAKVTPNYFSSRLKGQLEVTNYFTPDVPTLEMWDSHYVFVYGSLKKGNDRADVLRGYHKNKWCGTAVSVDPYYDLLMTKADAFKPNFPVLFEKISTARDAKIKGEMWLVPTEMIYKLDQIEGNTYMFERTKKRFWVGIHQVPAWVYMGIKDFWQAYEEYLSDLPRYKTNGKWYHWYNQQIARTVCPLKEGVVVH